MPLDFNMEPGKMKRFCWLLLSEKDYAWKTEMKKNAQWILSAVENNAVETACDHQDHVPTTPCFLFENTSKHPHACMVLTKVTQTVIAVLFNSSAGFVL